MIGLIPCAGTASRLDGLPKFLLPTDTGYLLGDMVTAMQVAGARVWIGASKQNATILRPYLSDSVTLKGNIESRTMCETLLAARAVAGDENVLLGMPDTHHTSRDAFTRLAVRIDELNWPVAVACWRIRDDQRGKLGQCDVQSEHLRRIVDKDASCPYPLVWGAIAWQPDFWRYITPEQKHVGMALQAAIDDGYPVRAFEVNGDYYDCGTREEYFRLCRTFDREVIYG